MFSLFSFLCSCFLIFSETKLKEKHCQVYIGVHLVKMKRHAGVLFEKINTQIVLLLTI